MCPAFKDEFVNKLSEREVLGLAKESFPLELFDKWFNADISGKFSSDRIFIRIILPGGGRVTPPSITNV